LAVVIMSIMMSMVLAMGTILFRQLRMTRETGNSVVAFYAADTGMERGLYDEVQCLLQTDTANCGSYDCRNDGDGNGFCDGVKTDYDTGEVNLAVSGAKYDVEFITSPGNGFRSSGSFYNTKRTVQITGGF